MTATVDDRPGPVNTTSTGVPLMSITSQAKKTTRTSAKAARAALAEAAQPTPPAAGETHDLIVRLNPALIVRDDYNARTTRTEPDDELKASVAELGVRDPIHVRPRENGTYGAFKGWRRAQAQQAANDAAGAEGRTVREIPAIIRADLVGNDAMTHLLSLIENEHREQMHDRDRIKAIETLALVEVSEEQRETMARALKIKRAELRAARQAARLDDARLHRASVQGFDLMQMAELADVSDVSDAARVLEDAHARDAAEEGGGRGHWDQALARLRQTKADIQARHKALDGLKKAMSHCCPTPCRSGRETPPGHCPTCALPWARRSRRTSTPTAPAIPPAWTRRSGPSGTAATPRNTGTNCAPEPRRPNSP
ncbi:MULTISPECIES: ParB/RepB/Spo0J family partition protein [Streptomyces]